jgi:DNA polymerase III epsilon subunit-like protein
MDQQDVTAPLADMLQERAVQAAQAPLPFKTLVLDTETSGLFNFKLPADDPSQPRLAEIAMLFLDEQLCEERHYHVFIRPDGWVMEPGATAVNNLTDAFLQEHGRPVPEALDVYCAAIAESRVVVAHHAQSDCKTMRSELRRAGRPDLFEAMRNICTMRGLVGVCKIPFANRGGYKWPSLQEACAHFKIPMQDGVTHTAMHDASLCAELLRWMRRIDVMPEPAVHLAKKRPESTGSGYEVVE